MWATAQRDGRLPNIGGKEKKEEQQQQQTTAWKYNGLPYFIGRP